MKKVKSLISFILFGLLAMMVVAEEDDLTYRVVYPEPDDAAVEVPSEQAEDGEVPSMPNLRRLSPKSDSSSRSRRRRSSKSSSSSSRRRLSPKSDSSSRSRRRRSSKSSSSSSRRRALRPVKMESSLKEQANVNPLKAQSGPRANGFKGRLSTGLSTNIWSMWSDSTDEESTPSWSWRRRWYSYDSSDYSYDSSDYSYDSSDYSYSSGSRKSYKSASSSYGKGKGGSYSYGSKSDKSSRRRALHPNYQEAGNFGDLEDLNQS